MSNHDNFNVGKRLLDSLRDSISMTVTICRMYILDDHHLHEEAQYQLL
jgi:hypothetical protein